MPRFRAAIFTLLVSAAEVATGETTSRGHWAAGHYAPRYLRELVSTLPAVRKSAAEAAEADIRRIETELATARVMPVVADPAQLPAGKAFASTQEKASAIFALESQLQSALFVRESIDDPRWLPQPPRLLSFSEGSFGVPVRVTVREILDSATAVVELTAQTGDTRAVALTLNTRHVSAGQIVTPAPVLIGPTARVHSASRSHVLPRARLISVWDHLVWIESG